MQPVIYNQVTGNPEPAGEEDPAPATDETVIEPQSLSDTMESDVRLLMCALRDTSGLTDEQVQRVSTVQDEELVARDTARRKAENHEC